MTAIVIQSLTATNQADLSRCDNSFTVEAELRLTAEDGRIGYSVEPVTPYVKRYGPEIFDAQAYLEEPDPAAWLAYVDGRIAGQILVHENWNRFAIIWDIAVDPPFRRRGVGRRLIARGGRVGAGPRAARRDAGNAEHQRRRVPVVCVVWLYPRRLRCLPVPRRYARDARDRPVLVPAVLKEPVRRCNQLNTTPNPPSAR